MDAYISNNIYLDCKFVEIHIEKRNIAVPKRDLVEARINGRSVVFA